jgi:hypothetical protein
VDPLHEGAGVARPTGKCHSRQRQITKLVLTIVLKTGPVIELVMPLAWFRFLLVGPLVHRFSVWFLKI